MRWVKLSTSQLGAIVPERGFAELEIERFFGDLAAQDLACAEASGLPTWRESPCGSGAGFDLVAQDEVGSGVTGLRGGQVLAQLRDGGGGPPGW